MRPHLLKFPDSASLARSIQPGPVRDITWDRPVFRPPLLPNPRVNFAPLPFMTHRLAVTPRQAAGR